MSDTLKFFFIPLLSVLFACNTFAQEEVSGDESAVEAVQKKTSEIYNSNDTTRFFLTNKSFRTKSTCGTEIAAYSKGGKFNRIIAKTCTDAGKMATEFYFENEILIFAFQSFEFFDEKSEEGIWRNFKGIVGRESRFYFQDGRLKFRRHFGLTNLATDINGEVIKKDAESILDFVKVKSNL